MLKIIQQQNATAHISPKLSCEKQPKACENRAAFKATVFFVFRLKNKTSIYLNMS
jgi:hypothetical protein